ncbi:MAG: peptidase T4 [Gammaproteobacteria bacterium]|nr:peptidase T4 [Gammaproteobacteria bacterium]
MTSIPISGLRVGHAEDPALRSGVTVILPDEPAVASVHVVGGAPGTRESDLLNPLQMVERIDALVLAGGSAYGLDAATGVQAWLREQGRGFPVRDLRVPIVPAAILFDLANGGDKDWGRYPPYRELGYDAAAAAVASMDTGRRGAGYGATTATTPGGIGLAAERLACGATVMAIMAVNAAGSPLIDDTGHFWAAPFERNGEFGGRGWPTPMPARPDRVHTKAGHDTAGLNTTIGVVVTDAVLSKVEAKQVAVMAHDGFPRALYPVHSPGDGDLLFTLSTGARALGRDALSLLALGTAAANVVARAIAQGVYAAMQNTDEGATP